MDGLCVGGYHAANFLTIQTHNIVGGTMADNNFVRLVLSNCDSIHRMADRQASYFREWNAFQKHKGKSGYDFMALSYALRI